MPVISPIERKTVKGRSVLSLIYGLLILGSVTTVYPFLLMLRLSTADATDKQSLSPIPVYWFDRDSLSKKYVLRKHAALDAKDPESPAAQPVSGPEWSNTSYPAETDFWNKTFGEFETIPKQGLKRHLSDYKTYLSSLDERYYEPVCWHADAGFESFYNKQRREHPERPLSQTSFLVTKDLATRDWHPQWDENWNATVQFLGQLRPEFRSPCKLPWVQFLKDKYGQFEVKRLNHAWGTSYANWTEVKPPVGPLLSRQQKDYQEFAMTRFPHIWMSIQGDYTQEWRSFLKDTRHIRTGSQWLSLTGMGVQSIEEVPWTNQMPKNDGWATLWSQFVHERVPFERRVLSSPDILYSRFLQAKYASLEQLNQAWGTKLDRWGDLVLSARLVDYQELREKPGRIARELTVDPYRMILSLMARENKAFINTFVLVVMSLIAALTVNPLAAYALSRFRLKGTHQVLLFFLATMALPGEIAMVPSFLLVKNLGLMNSFFALILPGAASGFGIFLLKGFFDSLPQELYEAATLDGAKELTIFARITMPLAQPILAVTGLGAVLGAYGTFLGAVLYLPDVNKWPLIPKLYELTASAGATASFAVSLAGLVVASIPTLLVFLFAQRMIMRGIVLPSLK